MFNGNKEMDISDHGLFLYELTKSFDRPQVMEIGTGSGQSTAFFALACKETNGHVLTLDLNECKEAKEFITNLDLKEVVDFRKANSTTAETFNNFHEGDIDILFIDSNHEYIQSLIELLLYGRKATYIIIHDTDIQGVDKAIIDFICSKDNSFDIILNRTFNKPHLKVLMRRHD